MRQTGKIIINKVEKQSKVTKANPISTTQHKSLTKCQILEFMLISINRLLIGFVTLYMCWMCLRLKYEEIPFHALLCTIGFACLMAEGLLAHYRANAWTLLCIRTEKSRAHWLLQVAASVIGLIGVIIKIDLEEAHFYTFHGVVGLITCIFLITSLATGTSCLFANEMNFCMRPLFNKALHNIWGLLTFTLAMISMFTAFETEIFFQHSLDANHYIDFKWLIQGCIIAIWLLSVYGPLWCLVYTKFCNTY